MFGADDKHTIGFRDNKLAAGERFVAHLTGWHGADAPITTSGHGAGAIILTDARLCFFRRGAFSDLFAEIGLHLIHSVETRLVHGHRRFHALTPNGPEVFKTFADEQNFGLFLNEVDAYRLGRKMAA